MLLRVAYDGTAFHGWARQEDQRTVASTLQGAVLAMDPRATLVRGASRTDAGVHAEAQLAAFDTEKDIPPRGWVLGINQHLPEDVAVRSASMVTEGFEPRFENAGKRYVYRVYNDRVRSPFTRVREWRIDEPLDIAAMREDAAAFVGTHDFGAFHSVRDPRPSFVRTISEVRVEPDADERTIRIVVVGTAFLYNMVRIMVGTLVDVGRRRKPRGSPARALESKERRDAGMTAPAKGLTLEEVLLDEKKELGVRWPQR